MQPLISPVDHESRHNSYRAENDHEQSLSENTPLLHRFPENNVTEDSNQITLAVVSLLLIILISGIIIGIYLLIVQNNSENVLPPVETPLQLVSRTQWDSKEHALLTESPFKAKQVIVVQTDTQQCSSLNSCTALLQKMQASSEDDEYLLPYNFLISSNGQTYEGLGWRRPSSMFSQYSTSALVLAFIGNFTEFPPNHVQVEEAWNFFAESISQQHLEPTFTVIGKNTKYAPKYLFHSLMKLPQWRSELSDKL